MKKPDAKNELQKLLSEAKGSSEQFIRDNVALVEQWVVSLSNGEISKEEFDDLIATQKLVAEEFVNIQPIGEQARQERLTLQILNLAAERSDLRLLTGGIDLQLPPDPWQRK
jgi:hypothetical protein